MSPGSELRNEDVARILDAAQPSEGGGRVVDSVDFSGAVFLDDIAFCDVEFRGPARFGGAEFRAKADFSGATFTGDVDFSACHFEGYARFDAASIAGIAWFRGARFSHGAWFRGVQFTKAAWFRDVAFSDVAWFERATFEGDAVFAGAAFEDNCTFSRCVFNGPADFVGARFVGPAWFQFVVFIDAAAFPRVQFTKDAAFDSAMFKGDAAFDGALFWSSATFSAATFCKRAGFSEAAAASGLSFSDAHFLSATPIGGLRTQTLHLDGAIFESRTKILVTSAKQIMCRGAQFRAGADLLVDAGAVALDETDFGGRSLLRPGVDAAEGYPVRLVSVRHARLANLTVSGLDLSACLFGGAHDLEQLRIENSTFALTPARSLSMPPRIWTRRQTLAEEHRLRATLHPDGGWHTDAARTPDFVDDPGALPALQIAAVYRSLRTGRERIGDAPGAADFYYGEMEMRRMTRKVEQQRQAGTRAPAAEQVILTTYWAISGYALRASRALATLVTVVLLFAILFAAVGFETPRTSGLSPLPGSSAVSVGIPAADTAEPTLLDAVVFAAGTATAIANAPDARLSATGDALRVALRIIGPLLAALALLSVRGRIKR